MEQECIWKLLDFFILNILMGILNTYETFF